MVRLVVLIAVLFIFPYQHAYAQPAQPAQGGSYLDISEVEGLDECDGGDAKAAGLRCRVNGDLPNPTLERGTTTHPCNEEEVEVVDPKTGDVSIEKRIVCVNQQTHIRNDNFIWSSEKDAGNYIIQYLDKMLERARLPLTPKLIWDITTRNEGEQMDSYIARACTLKVQTGQPTEIWKNELSKQLMTITAPYVNRVVENLEFYKSTFSTAKTVDQYYVKAIELVKPGTAYGCGYERTATSVERIVQDTGGKGEFTLVEILFQTILFVLEETFSSPKTITETARKPYSEEMAGGMVQATDELFADSRVSQQRKESVIAHAGIVETFRPCSLEFEGPDPNGQVQNQYEWETGGGTFNIQSRQHLMKVVDESRLYLESALLPVSHQKEGHKITLGTRPCGGSLLPFPGIRNEQDAVEPREEPMCKTQAPIGPPPGGDMDLKTAINEAASWAGIPGCVLEGIAFIEGASIEMEKPTCVPNQCGAAGPFQITIGQDSCGDNKCKSCGPSWADGSRNCNNESWALQKAGGTAADACNLGVAAKAAAAIVDGKANGFKVPFDKTKTTFDPNDAAQRQTIITAADAYYGVTTPIARLGNLSYGEHVYQNCLRSVTPGASYTHQDHNFPTPTPPPQPI